MLKLIFRIFISFLTISLFYFNFESVSHAYLGPGVGGGIITATIGFVVAILAALFALIWFPIKRLIKKRKEKKVQQQNKVD
tara:strand:- start:116 stop:358 length:243 start_codon:yes stop_codon:yes gene_type:complete